MTKLHTVALLARRPGLLALDELINHPLIDLECVATHHMLPKAEWSYPSKPEIRPEYYDYKFKCNQAHVCLDHVDAWSQHEYDLLIALSWRKKVSAEILSRIPRAINLHRGDLPKYPGARPVLQAIRAGETQVAITAHWMTAEIDGGDPIAKVYAPIVRGASDFKTEELTKVSLEPLYVPLLTIALAMLGNPTSSLVQVPPAPPSD